VACDGTMMSGACWSQESVRKPLARAHCKRRRCLRFLTNSILNQQLWNLATARRGHALILHCQAGAAPAGGEGVQGERVTREQSAVMYPQSAKIQLFVGIGKRSPAHVGSSEGEENDVGELGCSVRRGFRINELLHCKASEQYWSELLFPNKTKTNKTRKLRVKLPESPLSSWMQATLCRCTVERCTNRAARLPGAPSASSAAA